MANYSKKYTADVIRQIFADAGYTTLGDFEGVKTKVMYRCDQNHEHSMTTDNFKQGKRCPTCAGRIVTHEQVKEHVESFGYKLRSQYVRSDAKLDLTCDNGHDYQACWNSFQQGARCRKCAGLLIEQQEINQYLIEVGYKAEEPYKNAKTPMKLRCPNNHLYSSTWHNFRVKKLRCPRCKGRQPNNEVLTHKSVYEAMFGEGYELLDQYERSNKKMRVICPKNHEILMTWNDFQQKTRCAHCRGMIVTHEQVYKAFQDAGYTLLSQYENAYKKLLFRCPEGHVASMHWGNFRSGRRCGRCRGFNKTPEEQLQCDIRDRMRKAIGNELSRKTYALSDDKRRKRSFSYSEICSKLAKEIAEVLGDRPKGYHLDHIVPISFFSMLDEAEVYACWSVHNLRYITASENCRRRNVLTLEEAEQFSLKQLEILASASLKPKKWIKYCNQRGTPFSQTSNNQRISKAVA